MKQKTDDAKKKLNSEANFVINLKTEYMYLVINIPTIELILKSIS